MANPPAKKTTAPSNRPESNGNGQPTVVRQSSIEWIGPLPPPGALQQINEIVPGGAERLIKMAEAEQAHRIEMDKIAIGAEIQDTLLGKHYGAAIAILALIAAIVTVWLKGPATVAIAFLAAPILGIVRSLIQGRKREKD